MIILKIIFSQNKIPQEEKRIKCLLKKTGYKISNAMFHFEADHPLLTCAIGKYTPLI